MSVSSSAGPARRSTRWSVRRGCQLEKPQSGATCRPRKSSGFVERSVEASSPTAGGATADLTASCSRPDVCSREIRTRGSREATKQGTMAVSRALGSPSPALRSRLSVRRHWRCEPRLDPVLAHLPCHAASLLVLFPGRGCRGTRMDRVAVVTAVVDAGHASRWRQPSSSRASETEALGAQPADGVDWVGVLATGTDLEVQVRAVGAACVAVAAELLSRGDPLAHAD